MVFFFLQIGRYISKREREDQLEKKKKGVELGLQENFRLETKKLPKMLENMVHSNKPIKNKAPSQISQIYEGHTKEINCVRWSKPFGKSILHLKHM